MTERMNSFENEKESGNMAVFGGDTTLHSGFLNNTKEA